MQVLYYGIQIETFKFFRVIELLTHGIGQRRVLVEDVEL
jgi:hypothetical protein